MRGRDWLAQKGLNMKIERALSIQRAAVTRLVDVYETARCFKATSAQLNADVQERVFGRLPNGTPERVRAYLEGYRAALTEALYSGQGPSLVYGGFVGDAFMSTHRDRPDYYQAQGIAPSEFAEAGAVKNAGHYWGACVPPRPFFISEGA